MEKYWLSLHNCFCSRSIQNVTEPESARTTNMAIELRTLYRMLVSTTFGKTLGMCTPLKQEGKASRPIYTALV